MPNWCINALVVTHTDASMVERFEKAFEAGALCHEFLPMPKELKETDSGPCTPESVKKKNLKKYGYADWHDFATAVWGTKWDVGKVDICHDELVDSEENRIYVNFNSAWDPPLGLYGKLVELGFGVKASYYAEWQGLVGEFKDGKDCRYKVEFDLDYIKKNIPPDLDDYYGISLSVSQAEEE